MRVRKSTDERKDEIIDATLTLAHEVGPDRISTEAIAGRIGVTQAAVFRHFPRKQDIWDAVIGWVRQTMIRRWSESQEGHHAAGNRLRAILGAQLRFVRSVPALPALLLSREVTAGNSATRQVMLSLMAEFRQVLTEIIADGQNRGELRADIHAEKAANLLIAVVQGTAMRWLLNSRNFDIVAEGLALVDMTLHGIETPASPPPP